MGRVVAGRATYERVSIKVISRNKKIHMRSSFVFYGSWWEAIKNLPRDVQGDVLTAIIEYGLTGETTEQLKPIAKAMLVMAKAQIDINNQRFDNGKKGGRPKGDYNQTETKQKPNHNQTITKSKPNDNVNDNVNDIIPPSNPPDGGGAEGEGSSGKRQELEAKESALMAKEQELLKREAALKSSQRNALPPVDFVSPEFVHVFTVWLEYKRERKESYKSEKSLKAAYSKLLQLSGNDPAKASAIVEQSMANNWAGLFELKERKHAANTGVILTDNSATKYDQDDERWKR